MGNSLMKGGVVSGYEPLYSGVGCPKKIGRSRELMRDRVDRVFQVLEGRIHSLEYSKAGVRAVMEDRREV